MKRNIALLIAACLALSAPAQTKGRYYSASLFTVQNALPLGKFAGLFGEIVHPGAEFGYGRTLQSREKHDWQLEYKLGYFYHRFVQQAIPLTINLGYHYKFNKRLGADAILGAGYLHSIPATAKFKMNANGEYKNNKGIGRMQGTAGLSLGVSFVPNPASAKPVRLFLQYRQLLQFPFVKSYVPLLPYNGIQLGCSGAFFHSSKKH